MAKVIATAKGYWGGVIREPGASFDIPDEIWNGQKRRPSWVKLAPFNGKGDHDGDGKPGGSRPLSERVKEAKKDDDAPKAISVPADWKSRSAKERKALAVSIVGKPVPNAAEADRVISAYVESTKPEPFSDAPAPETAGGKAVTEALGGMQPDWVDPTGASPQAVDD